MAANNIAYTHVESPRRLVRVDKLTETRLFLVGVKLGCIVRLGLLLFQFGDVDIVHCIRDLLEFEPIRV